MICPVYIKVHYLSLEYVQHRTKLIVKKIFSWDHQSLEIVIVFPGAVIRMVGSSLVFLSSVKFADKILTINYHILNSDKTRKANR